MKIRCHPQWLLSKSQCKARPAHFATLINALHSLLHDTGCVDISPEVVKEDMEEFLQEKTLAFVVDTTVVVCRDQ